MCVVQFLASFGGLELWGKTPSHSWVHLASTADAGATSLLLDVAVDWMVGDEIIISPTNFEPFEVGWMVVLLA